MSQKFAPADTPRKQADGNIQIGRCKKDGVEDQSQKIWWLNPEKTADEKAPPVTTLLAKAQMDAESADDEENGNAGPSKAGGQH